MCKNDGVIVKCSEVLASKEKGGLGMSSFYALNRALLLKWVWRFRTQRSSLWARVIKGIDGEDGKLGKNVNHRHLSILLDNVHEIEQLKNHGTYLIGFIHKKMGNGVDPSFWEDMWRGDGYSLRRIPKGGIEQFQFLEFLASMEGVTLVDMRDRWVWYLEGLGDLLVAFVRRLIDECWLPKVLAKTRWINVVPIKINVHASKVREVFLKIASWWDVNFMDVSSYKEWLEWHLNLLIIVVTSVIIVVASVNVDVGDDVD
ncbi:hypothetical protein Tco_0609077 [Tanacetum coccineum]